MLNKFSAFIPLLLIFWMACNPKPTENQNVITPSQYLGLKSDAKYVGMQTCRQCHQSIYDSFIRTGMGQSIKLASKDKSVGVFTNSYVEDTFTKYHYQMSWKGDSLQIEESSKDGLHKLVRQVSFIIGSGQHTNSHLWMHNGYLFQAPMTYYTQKKKWDLPPGFENGHNSRFDRKIGLECMACHNAYPQFQIGSENKYVSVPQGIDCERCHGPGSYHVNIRSQSAPVDTAKEIDYTIVNPAKLEVERQFDICQRCHLQGNTVLKPGKSFYDFKPGDTLSKYMTVFVPRYENDDNFIMASHAERLKMSKCFVASLPKKNSPKSLRPYQSSLTCVTCHNPHKSVRETNIQIFNDACLKCHNNATEVKTIHKDINNFTNCVNCHMPSSGSIDIPHVSVHDHFIRKPLDKKFKQAIKKFNGLFAVNEKNPDLWTKATAYLNQFEKFEEDPMYLDSANYYIKKISAPNRFHLEVRLHFIRKNYQSIINLVDAQGVDKVITQHQKVTLDNSDAWTLYRIGEAYYALGAYPTAVQFFSVAVQSANFNMEFRNKLAASLAMVGQKNKAQQIYESILIEQPSFVPAYTSLGYLHLLANNFAEAKRIYEQGLKVDPHNIPLLTNLAGYYLAMNNKPQAKEILKKILEFDSKNSQIKSVLQQL